MKPSFCGAGPFDCQAFAHSMAAVSAHIKQGFFAHKGGYELTLILGVGALSAAFTGPGLLSFDALLGRTMSGPVWGVGALLVGLLGGAIQLLLRRPASQQTKSDL